MPDLADWIAPPWADRQNEDLLQLDYFELASVTQCSSKQPHFNELGFHELISPLSENMNMHNFQCHPLRRPNGTLLNIYVQSTVLGARNATETVQALKDLAVCWVVWRKRVRYWWYTRNIWMLIDQYNQKHTHLRT